jgi:hypothetical protein
VLLTVVNTHLFAKQFEVEGGKAIPIWRRDIDLRNQVLDILSGDTPMVVERIVADIDEIVRIVVSIKSAFL